MLMCGEVPSDGRLIPLLKVKKHAGDIELGGVDIHGNWQLN